MVQPAQLIDVCNPCCKEGNAVATIVESTDIISNASATMVKTSTRRTGGLSRTGPTDSLVQRTLCWMLIFRMSNVFGVLGGDVTDRFGFRRTAPIKVIGSRGGVNLPMELRQKRIPAIYLSHKI